MAKYHDPISGLTHLLGALGAAAGTVWLLIVSRGDPGKQIALLIYGLSLVGMFSASATYHLAGASPRRMVILRKIDHSAIYVLIAGTYTPICLAYFSGFWRWGLLGIIWGMAIAGVGVKVFVIHAPRWITAGIYLVMGWLSIFAIGEMLRSMPSGALAWLVTGGLFFTFGALIYILKRPNPSPGRFGFHEIWHIFVLLGCLSHFMVMAGYVVV